MKGSMNCVSQDTEGFSQISECLIDKENATASRAQSEPLPSIIIRGGTRSPSEKSTPTATPKGTPNPAAKASMVFTFDSDYLAEYMNKMDEAETKKLPSKQYSEDSDFAQEKIQEDFDFKDDILNRKSLTSCLPFLYECMTVEEVVVRLQANNILTAHQADSIRAEKTAFEKNQKMIDFVQKRGPEAFSCFMKSLTETGQKYIFDKLIEERKTIAERENLSKLAMWSTKLQISANQKFNLESLITEEELGQLKNIRVKELPEQIGQIGKGAYGKVLLFKFEDGSLRAGKKPKINLDNKSAEESQLKRYLSYALCEIKILHQLDHERIIKFFGFYLDQSQMIIFMDVMRGSVKDEINEKGYLSEVKAMNYFIQATEGLVYLHSRRPAIVHRDIKCENLLLTMEYNVKLADFGLASNLIIDNGSKTNLSTAPKSFVGTHLFHAPEIIQTVNKPEAYGRKSDIWSLACALVQMISEEVKVCLNQTKKLSNGTGYQQNRDMQMRNATWEICMRRGAVYLNQMKKLSNGTESQLNKEMQMRKITWGICIKMDEVSISLMKKLFYGTQ
uniref:Protein kinase domain-containing protein n=1 Tax=Plectus sambesii TaxID=2011161 RepID=A0A914VQG4_9BILA